MRRMIVCLHWSWTQIAARMVTRSDVQRRYRYTHLQKESGRRRTPLMPFRSPIGTDGWQLPPVLERLTSVSQGGRKRLRKMLHPVSTLTEVHDRRKSQTDKGEETAEKTSECGGDLSADSSKSWRGGVRGRLCLHFTHDRSGLKSHHRNPPIHHLSQLIHTV
jgi:hypothetical protein